MAKTIQGNAGKQKVSVAPVKALSNVPAVSEEIKPKASPVTAGPVKTPAPAVATTPKPAVTATPAKLDKPVTPAKPVASAKPMTPNQPAAIAKPAVPEKPTDSAKPATPAAPAPQTVPPAAAAPTISQPVAAMPATASQVVLSTRPEAIVKPAARAVPAAPAPTMGARAPKGTPASIFSLSSVPLHPGLTDFTAETWFAPAIETVRKIGILNAKLLDHACAELKATFAEAEAFTKAASPSEAVALQSKAFSRRVEASSAYIADLTGAVRTPPKAA